MSRYEDDLSRGRSNYSRDRDHAYEDGRHAAVYEPSIRRAASPGHSTHNGLTSQARLTYEPQSPLHPPRSPSNLEIPESHSRPRSLPPLIEYRQTSRDTRRERSHSKRSDSSESDHVYDDRRARTPTGKAKNFVDNAFTDSRTGIGVGVLGALVGGLAAREAVEATNKYNSNNGSGHRRHNSHDDAEHRRNQILGAVVGAAVGALGANAVEKRIEVTREKDRTQQERWEHKWRPRRSSGAAAGGDLVERREVVARPRSRGGHRRGGSSGSSGDSSSRRRRGLEREVDPGARSWKNVEDWLADDENRGHYDRDLEEGRRPRSNGKRSVDSYRY